MGLVMHGYAFNAAPNWEDVARVVPAQFSVRGYRHKQSSLCLMDVWLQQQGQHWPFRSMTHVPDDGDVDDEVVTVLTVLESALGESLQSKNWLALALRLASSSGKEVLVFAANDDEEDVAAVAGPNGIRRAQIREMDVLLHKREGEHGVRLELNGHDVSDLEELDDLEIEVRHDPTLVAILDKTGFTPNACEVWNSWCAFAVLGTGNEDELQELESNFDVAFERVQPAMDLARRPETAGPSRKVDRPWWKIW
ncbi:MAG: hypothetical protein ACK50G_02250 [bacterium]|jgi:hypothetical protein